MIEPLFSDDKLRENEQYRTEALELISSGEAIGFVGAGLSIELGYPSWPDLSGKLTTLANEVGEFVPPAACTPGQASEYADAVKNFIKEKTGSFERYWNFLGREFGPRNPGFTALQCDLMRLPLKALITSNYEPSLELACAHAFPGRRPFSISIHPDRAHQVSEFLLQLNRKSTPGPIAHLHGFYDDPKCIVLAASDYKEAYGLRELPADEPLKSPPSWPLRRRVLWALLASRRLIFFGFSMDDVDFQVMLQEVARDLWNWGQSIHYAIMSIGPVDPESRKKRAETIHREFGVRVVFYENVDGSHTTLNTFVTDALAFCETSDNGGYLGAINRRTDRIVRPYED